MYTRITELTWAEIRDAVKAVNAKLCKVIDDIDPPEQFTLLLIKYKYGETIINKGQTQLPDNDQTIPLNSEKLPKQLRDKLSYAPIPLGLLLNKSSEIFVGEEERIVPLKLLNPGHFFGLFEVIDQLTGCASTPIWSVAAGARTIFMLPKISETIAHNRLRKACHLTASVPKHLPLHWAVFREIANRLHSKGNNWSSHVLFFTQKWFEKANYSTDKDWLILYQHLLRNAWQYAQYSRDETDFGLMWQYFSVLLSKRNYRPRPYLINTLKHLINIARGSMPGFKPSDDSQLVAPTSLIQDAYIDVYGLKNYLPTLMHPANFATDPVRHLYYSLAFPTLLEDSNVLTRYVPNIIADQRELSNLINMFYESNQSHRGLMSKTNYSFYHIEQDTHSGIQSSQDVAEANPGFLSDTKKYPERQLCTNSVFWRGCIEVSKILQTG